MIRSIKLHNVGRYNQEANMADLKRVNFVFGANGSGKSTIARFVKHEQSRAEGQSTDPEFEGFALNAEGHPSGVKYEVYDQDFVRDLFDQRAATMDGLFTVDDNVELAQKIDALEAKLEIHLDRKERTENQIGNKEKGQETEASLGVSRALRARNKVIYERSSSFRSLAADVRDLGSGFIRHGNSIDKFAANYMSMKGDVPELEQGISRLGVIESFRILSSGTTYDAVVLTKPLMPDFEFVASLPGVAIINTNESSLQPLIAQMSKSTSMDGSKWVQDGLVLANHSEGSCPFCQQELTESRLAEVGGIFDDIFTLHSTSLKEASHSVQQAHSELRNWLRETEEGVPADFLKKTKETALRVMDQFDQFSELVTRKLSKLGEVLPDAAPAIEWEALETSVQSLNEAIDVHNASLADQATAKARFGGQFFALMVQEIGDISEETSTLANAQNKLAGLESQLNRNLQDIADIEADIRALKMRQTSIFDVVEKMNRTLQCYGFDTFRFATTNRDRSYEVIREGGRQAKKLSEGEKTFIAYLYFYHRALNTQDTSKKVVLIDDPISSLDQTSLFMVRQMTRHICEAAANQDGSSRIIQAIVLTHNAFFFDEIAARRENDYREQHTYFRIRKRSDTSEIVPHGNFKPLQGMYRGMWTDLYDDDVPHRLKPNLMRRILEHHFVYLGQQSSLGALSDDFSDEHRARATTLLSGLNSISHNIPDDMDFHQDEEACNDLRNAFEALLRHEGQEVHLKHMKAVAMGNSENQTPSEAN